MKCLCLCFRLSPFLALLFSIPCLAEDKAPKPEPSPAAAEAESDIGRWDFHLLPKSMEKDPDLRMTVISEMTEAGKKLRKVTPEDPMYYIPVSGGYQEIGDEMIRTQPDPKIVAECVKRALKGNGFLPASSGQPASLVITYSWGAFGWAYSENMAEQMAYLVKRAAFVGGLAFAQKAKSVAHMQLAATEVQANVQTNMDRINQGDGTMSPATTMGMFNSATMQPWVRFHDESQRNSRLVDQLSDSFYYVVVSAYDAQSVAKNNRVLLWRSHMTVELGVMAMRDCIPSLIAQASRYLGRDMEESAILHRKAFSNVETRIGELEFIGYDEARKKDKK